MTDCFVLKSFKVLLLLLPQFDLDLDMSPERRIRLGEVKFIVLLVRQDTTKLGSLLDLVLN